MYPSGQRRHANGGIGLYERLLSAGSGAACGRGLCPARYPVRGPAGGEMVDGTAAATAPTAKAGLGSSWRSTSYTYKEEARPAELRGGLGNQSDGGAIRPQRPPESWSA